MREVADSACEYIRVYKGDAIARVDADAVRAIGRTDWDEYTRLQKVKLRVQRLQMQSVAETRLARILRVSGITPRLSEDRAHVS